jgi:hypothetical protein
MDATIVVAIISAAAGLFVSALTFALTKAKEREAEWRSQKLAHYKEFMEAANGIVGPPPPTESKIRSANAANNIYLVGAPPVLVALREFLDEIAESNKNRTDGRHDELLTRLLLAIRDDLGISEQPSRNYRFRLWSGKARQ